MQGTLISKLTGLKKLVICQASEEKWAKLRKATVKVGKRAATRLLLSQGRDHTLGPQDATPYTEKRFVVA